MKNRPKIFISVFIVNSEGDKLILGKKFYEDTFSLVSSKLNYGEEFEECAAKIITNTINIFVEDKKRIKFLCSYNVVGQSIHNVAVDYYLQITSEEEKYHLNVDSYYFKNWDWHTFEQISKMHDSLSYGLQIFLKKFNVKNFEDLKNIVSN